MTMFTLSEATAFPDMNKSENKDLGFERSDIQLTTLKYKHFRAALKHPESEQMHQLMLCMTGFSENDIGELTPNDAAGISQLVFQSMKKYMELGQQMLDGSQGA